MGEDELPAGVMRLPDRYLSNDSDHNRHIGGFWVIQPFSRFEELLKECERCAAAHGIVPPYHRADFRS